MNINMQNEIKKALYKQKPVAKIDWADEDGNLRLSALLESGVKVEFQIPYEEALHIRGDINNMPAQLLIRWLITNDEDAFLKLSLKLLSVYLPHGVMAATPASQFIITGATTEEIIGENDLGEQTWDYDDVTLLLVPMESLIREELYQNWSDHVDYLTKERESWIKDKGRKKFIEDMPVSHFNYLVKNKYDIFGLLEQGLAIPIKKGV